METTTKQSMHPLIAIAAVAVTLFSLAGIGAVTGLIPTSHSQSAQVQLAKAAEEPAKPVAAARPVETTTVTTTTVSVPRPAARKIAARPAKPVEQAARSAEAPVNTVKAEAPVLVAQNNPPPNYPPAATPAKPLCYDCGVIEAVREIEKKGEATGSGAAIGGIAGGILGNQTGNGRGRDVMTVLGAIGGAFAGHAIEKNTKKVKAYEIDIRLDDGSSQFITQDTPPVWRSGDRVKLVNGVITANNSY